MKNILEQAGRLGASGEFGRMLKLCQEVFSSDDTEQLLGAGTLLGSFGFSAQAKAFYEKSLSLKPDDYRPLTNLATIALDYGDHAEAQAIYAALLKHFPDNPVIRRNSLTTFEYDPSATDSKRLKEALAWGEWAICRSGGSHKRPPLSWNGSAPLRIGYVSADFCQHTVGLFLRGVLKEHDRQKFNIFAYSAGRVTDWVTDEIAANTCFRDVANISDTFLAELIRNDGIDILVDLSGHTAGSRLTVFAYRPAPVMVSWLGYFATTGLKYIDAVLLDEWHVTTDTANCFVEPLVMLHGGRFCYQPVPWITEVEPSLPSIKNGYITFGSFNNTAKYNEALVDVWGKILVALPKSRLVLKWRTFNDERLRQKITDAFVSRGVDAARIELRGPAFHVDMLREYSDIDIALDPFPFTGGMTSCEALYMGVPVVTWPQSRMVSRQTFAFLSAIGCPELAANTADDYVRIAVALAKDTEQLSRLRIGLRQMMQGSILMNLQRFTRGLELAFVSLYNKVAEHEAMEACMLRQKILLNIGAGHPKSGARIPVFFQTDEWSECRLDIDIANEPDIVGSMLDMSVVADASVDAIYSSHTIEHLYPSEIKPALQECLRVLKADGFVVITCPDLQSAAQMIAEDRLMDVAYNSPAGAVTPFDIVFSHRAFTNRSNPYMDHHCGFTLSVLLGTLKDNGFQSVAGLRNKNSFALWVIATKELMEEASLRDLAGKILPV